VATGASNIFCFFLATRHGLYPEEGRKKRKKRKKKKEGWWSVDVI